MRPGISHAPVRSWSSVLRFGALGGVLAIGALMLVAAARGDESPAPLSPAQALELMRQGANRFAGGNPAHPNTGTERLVDAARSAHPFAVVLSCADPRVPVERIFDRGFGDLYVVRNTGGVADRNAVSGIENGCAQMGAPLLVVLGHNRCAAITAACTKAEFLGITPQMVDAVRPAVDAAQARHPKITGAALAPYVAEEQVWVTIRTILSRSAEVQRLVKAGKLRIVGAVCEVETGEVRFLGDYADMNSVIAAGVQPWPDAQPTTVARAATENPAPVPAPPRPAVQIAAAPTPLPKPDVITPVAPKPEPITSITAPASTAPRSPTTLAASQPPAAPLTTSTASGPTLPPSIPAPTPAAPSMPAVESKPPPVQFNPQTAPSSLTPASSSSTEIKPAPAAVTPIPSTTAAPRRTVAAESLAAEPEALPRSRFIPWAYLGAAALAILFAATCALRLARVADAQGRMRRSLTLGAKLAISFGATAGIILVLAAIAARSIAQSAALAPDSTTLGGIPFNQLTLAGAAAAAVLACIIAGVLLTRALRPLRDLRIALVALAEGDMGQAPINSVARDEVGESARCADKLAASVRDVLGEVTVTSFEVADAATRLNLSARQTAADSADLARHSAEADVLARETQERAETCIIRLLASGAGGHAHAERAPEMPDLSAAAESVAGIQRTADALSGTLESLDDFADRAELLALNAGIQAAKRTLRLAPGFDPVPDEARLMSGRATAAARASHGALHAIRDSAGSTLATLGTVTIPPAPRLAPIPEATAAVKSVAESSARLSDLLRTIAQSTEKTGASASLAATSAGELASHTDQLTAIVGRFKRTRDAEIDLTPAASDTGLQPVQATSDVGEAA